jgi:hypothetical protein
MTSAKRNRIRLPMRALSLRPHWAHAVLYLGKTVENRSWSTKYRGDFLLHAGGRLSRSEYEDLVATAKAQGFQAPKREDILEGGVIGLVTLVDVVTKSRSPWFSGHYGFVLESPRPIRFRPHKGQLGFFAVHGL